MLVTKVLRLQVVAVICNVLIRRILLTLVMKSLSCRISMVAETLRLSDTCHVRASYRLVTFTRSLLLVSIGRKLTSGVLQASNVGVVRRFPTSVVLREKRYAEGVVTMPIRLVVLRCQLRRRICLIIGCRM